MGFLGFLDVFFSPCLFISPIALHLERLFAAKGEGGREKGQDGMCSRPDKKSTTREERTEQISHHPLRATRPRSGTRTLRRL